MGNFEDMLVYYELYNKELSRLLEEAKHAEPARLSWELSGIDTAVHYDIMLVKLPGANITTSTFAAGKGRSCHRQKMPLNRDDSGRLLNDDGEVFSVIHQLDRRSTKFLWDYYLRYGDLLYIHRPKKLTNETSAMRKHMRNTHRARPHHVAKRVSGRNSSGGSSASGGTMDSE
jgi:hypothetical protein